MTQSQDQASDLEDGNGKDPRTDELDANRRCCEFAANLADLFSYCRHTRGVGEDEDQEGVSSNRCRISRGLFERFSDQSGKRTQVIATVFSVMVR